MRPTYLTRKPSIAMAIAIVVAVSVAAALLAAPSAAAYSVAGKTALVTGSSGGIGKGIARALADKGARIVVHYHTRADEARAFSEELGPDKCLGVLHCDFRNMSSIPAFFESVKDLCGKGNDGNDGNDATLDILVNNAGAITKLALADDDDELTVWQNTLAVNLHAPNLLSKLFARQFSEADHCDASDASASASATTSTSGGVILNVGSIHGDRSNEYMGAYAASKAGLESLTRTMAIEYGDGPRGIRANLIAPGIVPVERTEAFFADHPEALAAWTDKIPIHRAGTVEQIAEASLAMIENDWVTGAVWQIDGGMMARANMPRRDRP